MKPNTLVDVCIDILQVLLGFSVMVGSSPWVDLLVWPHTFIVSKCYFWIWLVDNFGSSSLYVYSVQSLISITDYLRRELYLEWKGRSLNLFAGYSGNGSWTCVLLLGRCLSFDDWASYFEDPCTHKSALPRRYSFSCEACSSSSSLGSSSSGTSQRLGLTRPFVKESLVVCDSQQGCYILRIVELTRCSSDAVISTKSAKSFWLSYLLLFPTRMKKPSLATVVLIQWWRAHVSAFEYIWSKVDMYITFHNPTFQMWAFMSALLHIVASLFRLVKRCIIIS